MKKFFATYRITGRYEAAVEGDNIKDILADGEAKYCDADFGGIEIVNGKLVHVEDEHGNYVYESDIMYDGNGKIETPSEYYCCYAIDALFVFPVEVENLNDVFSEVTDIYGSAEFKDLIDINGQLIIIEDTRGNILYDHGEFVKQKSVLNQSVSR